MADVQALGMDIVTEKSGHSVVGMAVSVCITPAAPAPLPMPYPLTASASEGITDSPLRTKICGVNCATIGSVLKTCHGNEPGTLKEVVSLNQMGPVAPVTGAFTVLIELGPAAITGSLCDMNKAPTPGVGSNASDAGGSGGGGGGGGGGAGAGGSPGSPTGPGGGGGGSGGSADGASAPGTTSDTESTHQCQGGHPVNLATGAVVDKATDIEVPGLIPLIFTRYYSSLRYEDAEATLGAGWAHGFEQRVEMLERTYALRDGQGRWIYFNRIAVGETSFHRGERLTLSRPDERTFRVYAHEERRTRLFEPMHEGGPSVLRRIEDPYGNAIVLQYKGDRLACVVDTVGRRVNVAWRGKRITSLSVSGTGYTVSYEYSRQGHLVAVADPLGHAERYAYDRLGRMTATTTKAGAQFVYEYEGYSPRCVSSYGPDGLFEVHLERDAEKRTTFVDGEEPRVVVWNEKGRAERLLLPDGTLLDEAAYDEDGLLIAKANGAGEGWQYWYDSRGRRVRAMDPCQQVTVYEYDGDRLVSVVTPDGHVTKYSYDDKGSIAGVEYPWGERYFFQYDRYGNLLEATGNQGRLGVFEYDKQHNLVAQTDSRGQKTTYRYDAMGRTVAERNPLGNETRATYDVRGRRTSLTQADRSTTSFEYDAAGRLRGTVDALGRSVRYVYSGFNALARVVGPDGKSWQFEYTRDERLSKIINPVGEEYCFERDPAGRVMAERTFDGRELRYDRDTAGRVSRIVYPEGSDRSFAYDRGGRVVRDAISDDVHVFQRDAVGRMVAAVREADGARHETRFERDAFGRVVAEIQGDRVVRYEVDTFGRRVRRVLPNGSTTGYTFDGEDGLIAVEHDGFSLSFERDPIGREVTRSTQAGVRISTRYDQVDRILEQRATAPGVDGGVPRVLAERRWTYDRVGRTERLDDGRWGTTTYAYDALDQLVETTLRARREVFTYDAAGSILTALEELGSARREAKAELAPGNVLTKDGNVKYAYDKRGRRVRKVRLVEPEKVEVTEYTWDARDHLRAVALPDGTRVALTYDALGRRVRKDVVAPTAKSHRVTEYVWDGNVLGMQLDSAEGAKAFVHAPRTFVPLLHQERGETFVCLVDRVGTPRELLTADGVVAWSACHSAWGRVVAEHADSRARAGSQYSVSSPFRLLGQISDDELGLCFTRFRVFDPDVGRWITPDPLGIEGGLNLYGFNGAPNVVVDPWGLAGGETAGDSHGGGKARDPLPDDAVVVRGGTCTADRFANGSGVTLDSEGRVQSASVNSAPGASVTDLSQGIRNGQVGSTTVGAVRAAGGDVVPAPTANNPNHCVMSGVTPEQAEQLFKPGMQPNPAK
jgi:RHS repeat-associated protein